MGWVPYPAHMGPRFAGPITALRAFKKKKCEGCAGVRVNMWAHQPSNLGQNLCELGVNVRLCACMPALTPQPPLPPEEPGQNYQHL